MSSHILIFWGFITSLLDDMHVILGHIPYPPRSSGICLFVHTIVIERMSLVMTFSGFHHVLINATLGHIPYLSGSFGRGWFVQTVLIDDMSPCYDIFGLHHVSIGCRIRAYPSNFVFTIFSSGVQTSPLYGSDVQTSSASHLLTQQIRRSDFVFCISGVQTSSLYGSDIQTLSASHLLAQQIRRSDFVFCVSGV